MQPVPNRTPVATPHASNPTLHCTCPQTFWFELHQVDRRRQRCANSWMQLRCPELVKSSSVYLNRTVMTRTQTQSRTSSFPACATELHFPCGTIWNATTARSSRSALLCPPAPPADSLVDPKTGGSVGRNWTQRTLNTIDNEREVWLTVDESASPKWLKTRENTRRLRSRLWFLAHTTRPVSEAEGSCKTSGFRKPSKRIKPSSGFCHDIS